MTRETFCFLKDILFLLPTHIYWKDEKGKYQWSNKRQLINLGLKNIEDILGKTDFDLIWNETADKLIATDKKVMETGIEYEIEETVTVFNGTIATFLSKKMPLKDKDGKVIGILGVSIDITDRKKKEKAEAANCAKTKFREFYHKFKLTNREFECIYYMVRGMSAKQIGRIMLISNRTVESYLNNAKFKFGCKSKQELILKAFENGMI